MDARIQILERKSIYLLREARIQSKNGAILWDGGKNSTANLRLCKRAFFGKIPFPVIHIAERENLAATIKKLIDKYNFDTLIVASSKDKESFISECTNIKIIYPLAHWKEIDVLTYIEKNKVESGSRDTKKQDEECIIQRLNDLGYM